MNQFYGPLYDEKNNYGPLIRKLQKVYPPLVQQSCSTTDIVNDTTWQNAVLNLGATRDGITPRNSVVMNIIWSSGYVPIRCNIAVYPFNGQLCPICRTEMSDSEEIAAFTWCGHCLHLKCGQEMFYHCYHNPEIPAGCCECRSNRSSFDSSYRNSIDKELQLCHIWGPTFTAPKNDLSSLINRELFGCVEIDSFRSGKWALFQIAEELIPLRHPTFSKQMIVAEINAYRNKIIDVLLKNIAYALRNFVGPVIMPESSLSHGFGLIIEKKYSPKIQPI